MTTGNISEAYFPCHKLPLGWSHQYIADHKTCHQKFMLRKLVLILKWWFEVTRISCCHHVNQRIGESDGKPHRLFYIYHMRSRLHRRLRKMHILLFGTIFSLARLPEQMVTPGQLRIIWVFIGRENVLSGQKIKVFYFGQFRQWSAGLLLR